VISTLRASIMRKPRDDSHQWDIRRLESSRRREARPQIRTTETPSSSTSSTARYRCSTAPSSAGTPGSLRRDHRWTAAKRQACRKARNQDGASSGEPQLLSRGYQNRVRKLSPRNEMSCLSRCESSRARGGSPVRSGATDGPYVAAPVCRGGLGGAGGRKRATNRRGCCVSRQSKPVVPPARLQVVGPRRYTHWWVRTHGYVQIAESDRA
jgi:hypothetical protein